MLTLDRVYSAKRVLGEVVRKTDMILAKRSEERRVGKECYS